MSRSRPRPRTAPPSGARRILLSPAEAQVVRLAELRRTEDAQRVAQRFAADVAVVLTAHEIAPGTAARFDGDDAGVYLVTDA